MYMLAISIEFTYSIYMLQRIKTCLTILLILLQLTKILFILIITKFIYQFIFNSKSGL